MIWYLNLIFPNIFYKKSSRIGLNTSKRIPFSRHTHPCSTESFFNMLTPCLTIFLLHLFQTQTLLKPHKLSEYADDDVANQHRLSRNDFQHTLIHHCKLIFPLYFRITYFHFNFTIKIPHFVFHTFHINSYLFSLSIIHITSMHSTPALDSCTMPP